MQIVLLDDTWEYSNDVKHIKELFVRINKLLDSSDYILNDFLIDGVIIYDDFEEYIMDHLSQIELIKIELITKKQREEQLLFEAQKYIERAIPILTDLAKQFYNLPTEKSWAQFDEMLEGLAWMNQILNLLISSPVPFHNVNKYTEVLQQLQGHILLLEEALRDKDFTLVADNINYEIISSFNTLTLLIQTTIDQEVVRYDIN